MARQICKKFNFKFSRSYRLFDNTFWLNNRYFLYKSSSSSSGNDDEHNIPKKPDYRGLFEKQKSYSIDDVKKLQETSNKFTNFSDENNLNKIAEEQRVLRAITSFKKYTELAKKNSPPSQPPRSGMRNEDGSKKPRDFETKVDKPPVKEIKRDQPEEEYFYRSGTTFKYDTEYDSDIEYPSHLYKPREKKEAANDESGANEVTSPERKKPSADDDDPFANYNKYQNPSRKNSKQDYPPKPFQAANVNQTQSNEKFLTDAIRKPSQNIQPRHKIDQEKNRNIKNLKYSKVNDLNQTQTPPGDDIWFGGENTKHPISIDSSEIEANRNRYKEGSQNPGSYMWSRDALDREVRKKLQKMKFLKNKEEVRENPLKESHQNPAEKEGPMFKYPSSQAQSSDKTIKEPIQKPSVDLPRYSPNTSDPNRTQPTDGNRSGKSYEKTDRNNRSKDSQNYPKISEENKRLLGLKSIDYLDQATKTTTKYFSNGMSTSGSDK